MVCALTALGVFLLLSSGATPALAHDNLGGDEMSMAIAIFIAGLVTIVGAALAGIWAWRNGQFDDVEQAKFAMLDTAPDLEDLPTDAGPPRPLRPVRRPGGETPVPVPVPEGGSHAAK